MRKYPKFREYAEAKESGLVHKNGSIPNQDIPKAGKPPELLKAKEGLAGRDYKGSLSTNPVQGTTKDAIPYKPHGKEDGGKVLVKDDGNVKDGLAFKGNKVQTPANSMHAGKSPEIHVQKVKGKGKLTSEQFIEQTRNMSPKEFVDFFLEGSDEPLPTVTDLYGNQFTPDPTQTIQYMAALMRKNPRHLSRLVRELKRSEGGMKLIMDENFSHPEFYKHLAEGMAVPEEGRRRCHRIARSMNEQYMEALNKFMFENKMNEEVEPKNDLAFEDGGPLGDSPQNPSGKPASPMKQPQGGAMGGGSGPAVAPPGPPQGGAMGGGSGPQVNAPAPGGAMGGGFGPAPDPSADAGMPGAGPGAMPPGMPSGPGGGPPPMPPGPQAGGAGFDNGQQPQGFDPGNGAPPGMPAMKPKFMGETAHANMIEEMGGFPDFLTHMSEYCLNCNKK